MTFRAIGRCDFEMTLPQPQTPGWSYIACLLWCFFFRKIWYSNGGGGHQRSKMGFFSIKNGEIWRKIGIEKSDFWGLVATSTYEFGKTQTTLFNEFHVGRSSNCQVGKFSAYMCKCEGVFERHTDNNETHTQPHSVYHNETQSVQMIYFVYFEGTAPLTKNKSVLCSISKLSAPFWKMIYASYSKLSNELKNSTNF